EPFDNNAIVGVNAVDLAAAAVESRPACPVRGALRYRTRQQRGNSASGGNFARILRVLFPPGEKFPR
ncbi:MAG TPA: hypothetical protein VH594_05600, partial [Trebonia sp.]